MRGGGPIVAFNCNGRNFSVAHDSDPARVLGGNQAEMEMNGDGTFRLLYSRVPGAGGAIALDIDDDREDQEFLQDIVEGKVAVDMSITYFDGTVYGGSGMLTGELAKANLAGTMEVNPMVSKWQKQ